MQSNKLLCSLYDVGQQSLVESCNPLIPAYMSTQNACHSDMTQTKLTKIQHCIHTCMHWHVDTTAIHYDAPVGPVDGVKHPIKLALLVLYTIAHKTTVTTYKVTFLLCNL